MPKFNSYILFLQAKHLQFVSGVDAISFWLATYSWDLINFLFPVVGFIIMFAAFQVDSLKDDLGVIVLLLVIMHYNSVPQVFYGSLKEILNPWQSPLKGEVIIQLTNPISFKNRCLSIN